VPQPPHKRVILLHIACLGGELLEPFAKRSVERFVLGSRNESRLFDQVLFSAESYVFHTGTVYTVLV